VSGQVCIRNTTAQLQLHVIYKTFQARARGAANIYAGSLEDGVVLNHLCRGAWRMGWCSTIYAGSLEDGVVLNHLCGELGVGRGAGTSGTEEGLRRNAVSIYVLCCGSPEG